MPTTPPKLTVHYVPVTELRDANYNPRFWPDKAIADLTKSIEQYGIVDALLANGNEKRRGILISGHFRLHVAKKLGYKKVPVTYVDIPDTEQEKRLNLLMNRVSGEWQMDMLREFDIQTLLASGFDDQDLASIWDSALGVDDDNFDADEILEQVTEPQTKPGDRYELGNHALVCADATDLEVIKQLAGDTPVSMLYIDPPFNISLSYDKGLGSKSSYGGHQTDDHRSDADYKEFLRRLLSNGLAVSAEDTHVYAYCDSRYIGLLQTIYSELGLDFRRVCLWIKGPANPTPNVAFNRSYEPVVYGTRGAPYLAKDVKNLGEILNREIGSGNRAIDDILDLLDIWMVKRDSRAEYEHPTQKPATLHEKPLRRCTRPGDAVLDLCAGSGSLLSACEQLKRRALLCEWEPKFCDIIVARYEALTGRKAKLVGRAK